MDCMVHGITKSRIQLSNFHFHYTLFYTVVLFLVWTHGDWFLQLYSSFSKILWLSGAFYVFTHIFKKLCPSSMENGFGSFFFYIFNMWYLYIHVCIHVLCVCVYYTELTLLINTGVKVTTISTYKNSVSLQSAFCINGSTIFSIPHLWIQPNSDYVVL